MHIQTLIPKINDFEHRIPLKQIVIEMASFLKQELSEKIGEWAERFKNLRKCCILFLFVEGVKLKAKFNPLPKWQKMQGAHTEILVYEDESIKKTRKYIIQ